MEVGTEEPLGLVYNFSECVLMVILSCSVRDRIKNHKAEVVLESPNICGI